MGVVGCIRCLKIIAVKLDDREQGRGWLHDCPRARTDSTEGTGRDQCWEGRIHFASQLYRFPALLEQAATVVEAHPLVNVLETLRGGPLQAYGELIPPGFVPTDQSPHVLVVPDSSPEWIALNAVALAHSLTLGAHPDLDNARPPPVDALAAVVTAVSMAGDGKVNIVTCERVACDFIIFSGRVSGSARKHACRQPAADGSLPRMLQKAAYVSAFELPIYVRLGILSLLKA